MTKLTEEQIRGGIERERVYAEYNKEHPIKSMIEPWRPDNWEEIVNKQYPNLKGHCPDLEEARASNDFELGADAMHKADVEWVKEHNDFTRLKICCERHGVLLTEKDWQEFIGENNGRKNLGCRRP